jgi:hypothetical protein
MKIQFNGTAVLITTIEQLGAALDEWDRVPELELWISADPFPTMCMLRNGKHAWLMYMRSEDDTVHSIGKYVGNGLCRFRLANGQLDDYPLSWCIDVEQCYKAVSYFYVNQGMAPTWIDWS